MRYFYDTEFLDDGKTIDLISIGIVAEDGREYYAVNAKVGRGKLYQRICRHEWLMANVVSHLPLRDAAGSTEKILQALLPGLLAASFSLDYSSLHVRPAWMIANEVREFLTDDPELWAWYGAYDHVALMQLFGPMISKPAHLPMWTNDLKQEAQRLGNPRLPEQTAGEHNALEDARWVRDSWLWLRDRQVSDGG